MKKEPNANFVGDRTAQYQALKESFELTANRAEIHINDYLQTTAVTAMVCDLICSLNDLGFKIVKK